VAATDKRRPLIVIVGVCASGKTTLSTGLKERGYNAQSLAQEHSVSPRFWQRRQPDFLVFLDCQFATIKRRKDVSWGPQRYQQQHAVLSDAREHADLVVVTDNLSPDELISYVYQVLKSRGVYPAERGEERDSQA
jgi:predicted ATPase